MNWLGKAWGKFLEFHRSRLIGSAMSFDKDDLARNFAASFESAKRLSDFVGMIIRVAFVIFACIYFFSKARSTDGYMSIVFGVCNAASVVVAFAMGMNIATIVFLYEIRELPTRKGRVAKLFVLIVAVATTFIIYMGVYELVRDIALQTAASGAP